MDVELIPHGDDAAVAAVRLAAAVAEVTEETTPGRGLWWRAGIEDAVAARSVTPVARQRYDAAPSPRRSRGATRA